MSSSPARLAAFHILMKIEQGGGIAVEMLHNDPVSQFSPADRRLVTELVYGVLRQKSCLDWHLTSLVERPLERLDKEVRMALRLGAYQILFLSRVPVRAAVHQSVELVKQARKYSAAGLINAVLRRTQKTGFQKACQQLPTDSSRWLSLRYSHPEWLVSRWIKRWGLSATTTLLSHNNHPPGVHFRSNSSRLRQVRLAAILAAEGCRIRPHCLGEGAWEVVEGDLYGSSLYQRGQLAVQDAGSQMIPRLLEMKPMDVCLDLCSGTGGKASRMAQLGKGQVSVIGLDSNFGRLRIAKDRHGEQWPGLRWIAADGTRPMPLSASFDNILVDVVCSGTGTLQRNPEIRWRLKEKDLPRLAQLQFSFLENAVGLVKPGGTLVYSTCSLESEENEQVVEHFLSSYPDFRLKTPSDAQLSHYCDRDGYFRLLPFETRSDGFFAAVMWDRRTN